MAVTMTETVGQIVEDALLEIEAHTMGQNVDTDQQSHAIRLLQRMLKGWQQEHGVPAFLIASQSLPLTTAASYTLSPVRPLTIVSARLKRNGIETPMEEITRREYDDLPQKDSVGLPTQFYYDRKAEAARFYVWPVLSAANGETVEITYERETEDVISGSDIIDLPVEWYEAAMWGLAARLCGPYGKTQLRGELTANARGALDRALGAGFDGADVEFRSCLS